MLASLAKLVDNLPNEKFFLLENYFEKLGHSREKSQSVETERALPLLILQLIRKIPRNSPSPTSNVEK